MSGFQPGTLDADTCAATEKEPLPLRLTEPQAALLLALTHGEREACERICHPNTAAALERKGLLTIEDGDGSFRPWFDCQITPAGLAVAREHSSPRQVEPPIRDDVDPHPDPQKSRSPNPCKMEEGS